MKIAILAQATPFPESNGKSKVMNGIVNYYTRHNHHVDYFYFSGDTKDHVSVSYNRIEFDHAIRRIFLVLGRIFSGASIQEAVFSSNKGKSFLERIISEEKYDVIIYDTVRIQNLIPPSKIRKLSKKSAVYLYMDDMYSIRFLRMLNNYNETRRLKYNPLGNFDRFLPGANKIYHLFPNFLVYLLKFEIPRLYKSERNSLSLFDKVFLISEDECRNLSRFTRDGRVYTLKVNILSEGEYNRDPIVNNPQFVFLGDMSVPHNKDGLLDLIENYLPIIISVFPDFRLLIIGKGINEDITQSAKKYHNNIEIKGFVDDLNGIFSRSIAMISPLNFGSGVKIKVIESISRGLPVIGRPVSFEGISEGGNFEGLFMYEDSFDLVKHIAHLLDREENLKISQQAFNLFRKKFSKSVVDLEYNHLLDAGMKHKG